MPPLSRAFRDCHANSGEPKLPFNIGVYKMFAKHSALPWQRGKTLSDP